MKNFIFYILSFLFVFQAVPGYSQLPLLNSLKEVPATIFLDFDGQTVKSAYWQNNTTFICTPSGLTNNQITEIFNRVSEDYRPFNVNITTDSTVFLSAPPARRTRIIVTATSDWYPGVGGIAYIGSFTWGDDTPGFVFTDKLGYSAKNVAEACSHESGHTVGLSHQSRYDASCNLVEQYSSGNGSGEIGWAPIMGNSYSRNMTGWNLGPTPYGCVNNQDNLTIITSSNNFTYRTDDFSDNIGTSSFVLPDNKFSKSGIVTTTSDKDAFKFTLSQSGNFHLSVTPYSFDNKNNGANLDVKVDLYSSNKSLIKSYNPADKMEVIIDTVLQSGSYYFSVSGAGNEYAPQYGSLGSYTIEGASGALLPIKDVQLSGTQNGEKHLLQWNIVSDDPIKEQLIEVSTDGINFSALAASFAAQRNYNYVPQLKGNLFYRIKVTSVLSQVMYSNVISLKATADRSSFIVSTFVHDNSTVHATEAFRYRLTDVNGRTLLAGTGQTGINTIYMSKYPAGIYLLQMISSKNSVTERIVKQ